MKTKADVVQACTIIGKRYDVALSTHRENGKHNIELGPEPHIGRTIYRGSASECLIFLDGFSAAIEYAFPKA
jgi:hypothetical protein